MSFLLVSLMFLSLYACNARHYFQVIHKEISVASSTKDVKEIEVAYKSSIPVMVKRSELECNDKRKARRGRSRKLINEKETSGGIKHKRHSKHPVVNLDYAPPRTHPPHHN
ncbi:hypothetical protein ACHQM5_011207 [Ranunculus cassubicifolius]